MAAGTAVSAFVTLLPSPLMTDAVEIAFYRPPVVTLLGCAGFLLGLDGLFSVRTRLAARRIAWLCLTVLCFAHVNTQYVLVAVQLGAALSVGVPVGRFFAILVRAGAAGGASAYSRTRRWLGLACMGGVGVTTLVSCEPTTIGVVTAAAVGGLVLTRARSPLQVKRPRK